MQKQKVDSRIFTHNAPIFSDSQAAGFCDDFVGFQGGGEGIYLGDNEQAPAAESSKSAAKPTPTQQNEDSSTTITRTHIISALNARGIATAIHYPTPLHLQEVFSHLGYKKGDFPISEQIAQEIFSIPFSPYLTEAAQEHIARVLREIFAQI